MVSLYKQLSNIEHFLQKNSDLSAIIFCGDLVNQGEPVAIVKNFIEIIEKSNLPLFWVPGNNDFGRAYYRLNSKYPSVEGRVVKFDDRIITGVGGSPASWAGQYAGEKMIDKKSIAGSIFLSHVPPPGILNFQKKDMVSPIDFYHCDGILKQVQDDRPVGRRFSDAPLVHICGHVHYQWGVSYLGQTKVIKLGSAETGRYAIMDLESLAVEFGEMR